MTRMCVRLQTGGGLIRIQFAVFCWQLTFTWRRRVRRSGSSPDTALDPSNNSSEERGGLLLPTNSLPTGPAQLLD